MTFIPRAGCFTVIVFCLATLLLCPHSTSLKNIFSRSFQAQKRLSTQLYSDAPTVESIDKESNIASMLVTIPADETQKAFSKACELFNEEVKERGYSVPGFRKGAKLPASYLYQIFGEGKLKQFCGTLMSEAIQVMLFYHYMYRNRTVVCYIYAICYESSYNVSLRIICFHQ